MPDTKLFHTVPFYSRDFECYIRVRVERRRKTLVIEIDERIAQIKGVPPYLFITPYALSYQKCFPDKGLCARVSRGNQNFKMVPVPLVLIDAGVYVTANDTFYRHKERTRRDWQLRQQGNWHDEHDPDSVPNLKKRQLTFDFSPPAIPLYGTVRSEHHPTELRAGQSTSEAA